MPTSQKRWLDTKKKTISMPKTRIQNLDATKKISIPKNRSKNLDAKKKTSRYQLKESPAVKCVAKRQREGGEKEGNSLRKLLVLQGWAEGFLNHIHGMSQRSSAQREPLWVINAHQHVVQLYSQLVVIIVDAASADKVSSCIRARGGLNAT